MQYNTSKSPYLVEQEELIKRLRGKYPYPVNWLRTKSNSVLLALLIKSKNYKKVEIKSGNAEVKRRVNEFGQTEILADNSTWEIEY